ncbi:MAG TPA: malonic semialdehyde reductase [Caulobacteraceae bacterium]|nr:malonic semialdehyde reductase [Caulobacteraceae bacterium]
MPDRFDDAALDQIFRKARTRNGWATDPLPEALLREVYDLAKFGPTAANSTPARFVFVVSAEGKEKLASVSAGNNQEKIRQAPATVIVGYDLDFPETLPKLFPHAPDMKDGLTDPAVVEPMAFRNSSLQGAYLIIAARALGLDCGPMSGFSNAKVDALFFAGTKIKSNFLCSLGHGTEFNLFARSPRHAFEDVCQIV